MGLEHVGGFSYSLQTQNPHAQFFFDRNRTNSALNPFFFLEHPQNPKFNCCLCESRDVSIAEQMDVYVRLVKIYSLRLLVE
jgi:hypothetical protein